MMHDPAPTPPPSSPPGVVPDNSEWKTHATLLDRLAASRDGEREFVWSEFRSRYAPVIAGFAARCGASRQDIDDIVQEVLTNFLRVSGGFVYDRRRGRFRGYLKTCTVRASLRLLGKDLKFRGIPLAELDDAELAVEPIWDDVWERQLMSEALHQLRVENQEGLAFRAFEQYVLLDRPADIVAEELGTSINNVHQAKTRMTKLLREKVRRLQETDML